MSTMKRLYSWTRTPLMGFVVGIPSPIYLPHPVLRLCSVLPQCSSAWPVMNWFPPLSNSNKEVAPPFRENWFLASAFSHEGPFVAWRLGTKLWTLSFTGRQEHPLIPSSVITQKPISCLHRVAVSSTWHRIPWWTCGVDSYPLFYRLLK